MTASAKKLGDEISVAVIDDDHDFLDELQEILGYEGVEILPFLESKEFIDHLTGLDNQYTVLIDLEIPGEDITETLRTLTRFENKIHVIFLSGKHSDILSNVSNLAESIGLRVVGYVQKPVSLDKLVPLLEASRARNDHARSSKDNIVPFIDYKRAGFLDNIVNLYQPIYSYSDNKIVKAEALCRYRASDGSLLAPAAFLDLLKEKERMYDLTIKVMDNAIRDWLWWDQQSIRIAVSVNVPPDLISDRAFVDDALEKLDEAEIPPAFFTFEITEDENFTSEESLLASLIHLRISGFGVSLDDYGTSHSSLKRYLDLPFSELKIDRSLLIKLLKDEKVRNIVVSTIAHCKSSGISVVTEGIETEDVLNLIGSLGSDYAQGYLISKPLPSDSFVSFVKEEVKLVTVST